MSDFAFYFQMGWQHILSWGALDHQLFIMALVAIYTFKETKQLLILITAFTIGHSITLALSVFDIVRVSSVWIEFLIPCTIVIAGFTNFFNTPKSKSKVQINYYYALFFGLIHGLGFANTLKIMLAKGQNFIWSLFAFNVGLEVGQLIFVAAVLIISTICIFLLKFQRREWQIFLSSCAFALALQMAVERWPL